MTEALIGLIGTIFGTIIGFALSETATWFRARRTEQKQVESVRTILSLEIAHNLSLLQQILDEPAEIVSSGRLPAWSHQIWESQLPIASMALTPEEIKQVHKFHYDLYSLKKLPEILITQGMQGTHVSVEGELREGISALLANGNPLERQKVPAK